MKNSSYLIGSSYYPEQWEQSRWEEDFHKMASLGFNCVRMGEFAWSFFEPRKGEFRFQWMDDAIALAAGYGIKTVLCTPTASLPPWLRKEQPDVLGGDEKGPFQYGARKGYCVNSEAFLSAADRVVTAVAEHFGGNINIVAWQLDNEPGYPFACYDGNCLRAFREWLRHRYKTLDNLNNAWGSAFWSHVYGDWDEIELPINVGDGAWNPGERLDYRHFFSDGFVRYLARQAAVLRSNLSPNAFVFTNWPNAFWSVNIFEAVEDTPLDATGWDNYGAIPGITEARKQFGPAIQHDLCRCAGPDQRFLIAEQAARMPATARQSGVALQTWQDLAHGALGTLFFEWRSPVAGAEQGYASVLNLDGSYGPAENELRNLSAALTQLPWLASARTEADIALLFSYPDEWNQGFWQGETGYDAHVERWYVGIKTLGRNVDVASPGCAFDRYRLIVAPRLEIVDDGLMARLTTFVEGGGLLVLDSGFGTRDTSNRLYERSSVAATTALTGAAILNSASKQAIAGNLITGKSDQGVERGGLGVQMEGSKALFQPWRIVEHLAVQDATPFATFIGGPLHGEAAATVRQLGSGHVVYIGFDTQSPEFYEALAKWLGTRFAIKPLLPGVPPEVEVVSRVDGDQEYVFLLNLTEDPRSIPMPPHATLLRGEVTSGCIRLPGLGVSILSRSLSRCQS